MKGNCITILYLYDKGYFPYHRVFHITVILFQYFSSKLKVSSLEKSNEDQFSEIEILREELSELSTDMKSCTEKEAKLLEFTERLTETNVSLQVG